jgi:hypothetical protein
MGICRAAALAEGGFMQIAGFGAHDPVALRLGKALVGTASNAATRSLGGGVQKRNPQSHRPTRGKVANPDMCRNRGILAAGASVNCFTHFRLFYAYHHFTHFRLFYGYHHDRARLQPVDRRARESSRRAKSRYCRAVTKSSGRCALIRTGL